MSNLTEQGALPPASTRRSRRFSVIWIVPLVSVGSPIFFRDLNVGEVLGWDIADMAEYLTIHAFVRAPYDSYFAR